MRRAAILLIAAAPLAACSLFSASRPTYSVTFPDRAARIDEAARTTIVEAARVANARPSDPLFLSAFADPKAKDAAAAAELARSRTTAVAEALTGVGVNAARIVRTPRAVDLQAEDGAASRRVQIDIGR